MAAGAKAFLQVGAQECAINAFWNDWFSVYRADLRLEVVPWLTWPIVGFWVRGIVPDVPHGPTPAAPLSEQSSNLSFGVGVVSGAATGPTRMVDRVLQIDQQQDTTRRRERGAHPRTLPKPRRRSTRSESDCWERVSCPRFEAHELSELFAVCSGGCGWFGSGYCGRRT